MRWYAAGMTSKPYIATPDELAALDDGLTGSAIPDAELPANYREEAARLRREANIPETIEMRVALLAMAEQLDQLASGSGRPIG